MQKSFFLHFVLGDKDHIHLYDLGDIVMPLIVYPNYGRNQKMHFISVTKKIVGQLLYRVHKEFLAIKQFTYIICCISNG
jgi:hypothetical protein